ncbi:NAD-dependent epimerase/dehydratase family protein, partial [Aduncisulcus paluster]
MASSYSSKESVEDIKSTAEVNIVGTINMLEAAHKVHVQKFIFTSTSAVYGNPAYVGIDENHPLTPLKPYGMTKRSAEEFIQLYARLHNMPYTILRLSTVYGKRQPSTCDGDMIAG